MHKLVSVLLTVSALAVQVPQRRMGLGVQYSTVEIYRPDQGFIQPAKLNATIIEEQIDRFLKDGKKPPVHKEIRPDIVGLQAAKADLPKSEGESPFSVPPDTPETPSIPLYSKPVEPKLEGLLQDTDTPEAVSEKNSFSFMLLCILGLGLILTLAAQYYKGVVAF